MQSAPDNVVLLRPGTSFLKDSFVPPFLPPLLELRKSMGLSFKEAAGILYVSEDSLSAKEREFREIPHPYCISTMRGRYLYFLFQFGHLRERNILQDHLTLLQVRENVFRFDHATMGSMYGGYTARQWHNFEMHEAILPRRLLAEIERDAHNMQTRNFDQV